MRQKPINKLVISLILFAFLILIFIFSALFLLKDKEYSLNIILGFGFLSFIVIILAIIFVSFESIKEIILGWSKDKKELKFKKEEPQLKGRNKPNRT
ncbi:MAG TPA: hypothetical protein VJJ21_02605 [Candidatus Nanoarchaeia archaeon]|nr:hypothetical protein [Candidatus Nanoarchaeia archaeon]